MSWSCLNGLNSKNRELRMVEKTVEIAFFIYKTMLSVINGLTDKQTEYLRQIGTEAEESR
jgi:hypothetical protein